MGLTAVDWVGRALRKAGNEILRRNGIKGVWIDVGAHHGELTLWHALHNPGLRVYALEPNLRAAAWLMGRISNMLVFPMAVAEHDGFAKFFINEYEASSSMLRFDEEELRNWIGGEQLRVTSEVTVPTVRLDTFMNLMEIEKVDYLKIDAEGMDLAVLRSAGRRLDDVQKVTVEVIVKPKTVLVGAPSKKEMCAFLEQAGFTFVESEDMAYGQSQNLTFARRNSGKEAAGRQHG